LASDFIELVFFDFAGFILVGVDGVKNGSAVGLVAHLPFSR